MSNYEIEKKSLLNYLVSFLRCFDENVDLNQEEKKQIILDVLVDLQVDLLESLGFNLQKKVNFDHFCATHPDIGKTLDFDLPSIENNY